MEIKSPFGSSEKEKLQEKIFISTFSMIAKLADADGVISKNEAQAVDGFIKEVLKLEGPKRQFAIQTFNKTRGTKKTFQQFAAEYRDLLQDRPKMYEWMIDVLLRVSVADQTLAKTERDLLLAACETFGISESRFEQLLARYLKPEDETPYRVLGLTSKSEDTEITERYKQLLNEYDPQRVASAGLASDFIKLAEERHKSVQEAYAAIRNKRGL